MNIREEIATLHLQIRRLEELRLSRISLQRREKASATGLSTPERHRLDETITRQTAAEDLVNETVEYLARYLANVAPADMLSQYYTNPEKATSNPQHEYAVKRVARRAIALNRLAEPFGGGFIFLTPGVVSRIKKLSNQRKTDPSTLLEDLLNDSAK